MIIVAHLGQPLWQANTHPAKPSRFQSPLCAVYTHKIFTWRLGLFDVTTRVPSKSYAQTP